MRNDGELEDKSYLSSKRGEICSEIYETLILLKQIENTGPGILKWMFPQDSAPAHAKNATYPG